MNPGIRFDKDLRGHLPFSPPAQHPHDHRHHPADVTAAARAVTAPALRTRAAGLSEAERALACWIAERSLAGADTASGAVFEAAQEYLPVGKTAYHEHLNGLAKAGIVDLVPGKGRGREVRLRYDAGDVAAACKAPDRTCKIPNRA